ncbi:MULTISPECIES: sulfite exporter TauE/SafE family protein [unclassified Oceanobacter]|uniref:sulfite exporter TauE/SafE family protein n=1 Tax=unclassified Oceanobacter TaxID=2620260 RepID=UPI002733FED6|nr:MULTISPECIES: sulfite exporter TauE/SafE family protein [unclassified Oceanobacter]MDP2610554.1 sulfite exporter TauE/SafE family protein [Oceanobacter sp. 1_MG-2023]MDP2613837.1 sulfite exporter TauE/SafE family protein [Oceanobacter sp. 2_MG-2023]
MWMGFEPGFWLLAVIAVLITGISKSGFAGGVGVVAVPLMTIYIDPRQAAAIMLPLLLLMDFFSVRFWWGKQNLQELRRLLVPAALGLIVGYLLFDWLNADMIKMMLGILSLAFALWGLGKKQALGEPRQGHPWVARVCGLMTGFTSFVAHAGGPPLNLYLLPLRLPRPEYLATMVVTIACLNVVKLIPYGLLGQLSSANLMTALILMPFAWMGARYGVKLQALIDDKTFYRIIYLALGLIGLRLLWDAI